MVPVAVALITADTTPDTSLASAALIWMRPAPWTLRPNPPNGTAVDVRAVLTWSGVRDGRAAISKAAAPDVTAEASEVPDPLMYDGATSALGFCDSTVEPG